MSAGDVYKLTLKSHQGAVQINNVFHYRQTFGFTGGDILAQEFINEVYPDILPILSNYVTMDEVEWLNYNDDSDFGINNSIANDTGGQAGEVLPTFNAWGFQYNRETRSTRNGAKRFSPIAEADQNFGIPTAAAIARLDTCAASLGQFVNLGGTEIWQPVIARLSADGSTVLLTNDVKNVTFKRLSSQTSRKNY